MGTATPATLYAPENTTEDRASTSIRMRAYAHPDPLSRVALRPQLRVNNAHLGDALHSLEERGFVRRTPERWTLPPIDPQLELAH